MPKSNSQFSYIKILSNSTRPGAELIQKFFSNYFFQIFFQNFFSIGHRAMLFLTNIHRVQEYRKLSSKRTKSTRVSRSNSFQDLKLQDNKKV